MLGRSIYRKINALGNYQIDGTGRSNSVFSDLNAYHKGDLCDVDFVKDIGKNGYDFIIHCAAIVDLNVCENNPQLATQTHIVASKNLAEHNPNATFLYISTDSVFNGKTEYNTENANPEPLNYYALSKHLGEVEVAKIHEATYILRLNVFGFKTPFGKSIFEWAYQSLKNNQPINGYTNVTFNPLYAGQIGEVIHNFMAQKPAFGIYNLGCETGISKYEFVMKIANDFNLDSKLITKFEANFEQSKINRPYHTTTNINKLKNTFPDIDLSMETGFKQLKSDLRSES